MHTLTRPSRGDGILPDRNTSIIDSIKLSKISYLMLYLSFTVIVAGNGSVCFFIELC